VASIVLIRDSAGLRALAAECPHAGYLVKDNGGGQLLCPAHNSLFSAKDGELLRGPASYGLSRYVVTETGGEIFLTL
jgi:nitrite reductase/ring-hydroxylating ferredoxin subunit